MNAEMLKRLKGKVPPKMGVDIKVEGGAGRPGIPQKDYAPGQNMEESGGMLPGEPDGDESAMPPVSVGGSAEQLPDLRALPIEALQAELDRRMAEGDDKSAEGDEDAMFHDAEESEEPQV